MTLRNTIIAFLLMCLLIGALIYVKKGEDEKIELEEKGKLIFGVSEDEITQIRFFTDEGEFLIKKQPPDKKEPKKIDPGWQLMEPVNAKADRTLLSGIISNMEKLSSIRKFEINDSDLKNFSLDKPSFTIEYTYKSKGDKEKTKTVYFGDKNPDGDAQYAKYVNSNEVHLVDTSLHYLHNKKMKDFRDKKIFDFEKDSVDRIEATFKDGKRKVEVSKHKNDYLIATPFDTKAEKSEITKFINNIINMRAVEFPSEDFSKTPSQWGLNNPFARFNLVLKEKGSGKSKSEKEMKNEGKIIGFSLGKPKALGTKVYLKREDSPVVFEVRSGLEKDLALEMTNIVSKKLADFDRKDIVKMKINYQGKATELDLKGGKWILSLKSDLADQEVAKRILSTFANYRAKEFISQKSSKKYGFTNDSLLGLFINRGNTVAGKIMFGAKTDGNQIYATGGNKNFIYKAAVTQYENIIKDLENIRNRKLYIEDKDKISNITFKKGDKKVIFAKTKKDDNQVWEVKTEGDGPPLYDKTEKPEDIQSDVEKIINFVTENKIADYIDVYDKNEAADKYGINDLNGILEISKVLQDTRKIAFGKTSPDGKHVYVWKQGLAPYYKIKKFDLDPVLKIFDKKSSPESTQDSKSKKSDAKK